VQAQFSERELAIIRLIANGATPAKAPSVDNINAAKLNENTTLQELILRGPYLHNHISPANTKSHCFPKGKKDGLRV
jgi:hypothetical protein